MTTWQQLLSTAGISIEDLKRRLPLEWVVNWAGVSLERVGDGRLVGLCPLHNDEHPSFAVFGDQHQYCGCWSCDFAQGDVLDFLQAYGGQDFQAALQQAIGLLQDFEAGVNWEPSPPPSVVEVDQEALTERARLAWRLAEGDLAAIRELVQQKHLPLTAEWLHHEFYLGVLNDHTVLIPHLGIDGSIRAYKTRILGMHPLAAAGSKLDVLYGAWRDQGRERVILCEGESDTWRVAWEFRDHDTDVLGLPSGAKPPRESWIQAMRDRRVALLFDGDLAGRRAAKQWHAALTGVAAEVRVVPVDDGADACTLSDLRGAVAASVLVPPWTGLVDWNQARTTFVRTSSGAPICNWALEPTRLITLEEGGHAIEGRLPDGRRAVITTDDLSTESAARSWSNHYGYSWLGSVKDAQSLLELLLREGPFVARGRGSRIAGWHRGHFVLPGRASIGPAHWVYVEPTTSLGLERYLRHDEGNTDPAAFRTLLGLHRPEVLSPILAWLAAAPLRSLCRVFPPLAVVGGSGAGKTTLLNACLRAFGWAGEEHNLTGSTPYGVQALVGLSNAVPVWFDEYRPGARRDTLEALDQALRDSWTGSMALRGGVNRGNYGQLTGFQALAPLIVSGEDTFTETSHIERLALVRVPQQGRNAAALRELRESGFNLGPAYLEHLVAMHWAGLLRQPEIPDADRPTQVSYVLHWGWELLSEFVRYVGLMPGDLPELDLTLVDRLRESASEVPPILDALTWALDERDRTQRPIAWIAGDDVHLRPRALVQTVRDRGGDLRLPGGERAVVDWLEEWNVGACARVRTRYGSGIVLEGAWARLKEQGLGEDLVPEQHNGFSA